MHELVYGDTSISGIIREAFPNAIITDASDMIHEHRFEVDIPELSMKDWTIFASQKGFTPLCFGIEVALYDKPDWLIEAVEELKNLRGGTNDKSTRLVRQVG